MIELTVTMALNHAERLTNALHLELVVRDRLNLGGSWHYLLVVIALLSCVTAVLSKPASLGLILTVYDSTIVIPPGLPEENKLDHLVRALVSPSPDGLFTCKLRREPCQGSALQ
jgi:hypothetical protein